MANPFNTDLAPNPANFQPLTPLTFLDRAASVMPEQVAIIHGARRSTYREFYRRSRRLASALANRGMGRGDTVSVLLPNVPSMLEAHYGVPMCGAVLHAINTRLDAKTIAFQLDHAGARILIVDSEWLSLASEALDLTEVAPLLIVYNDPEQPDGGRDTSSGVDYESFLAQGNPDYAWLMPEDEWDAISISYTSGTTGNPKGVVSHHR